MCLHTKHEFSTTGQSFQALQHYRQTDRHTYTQTDMRPNAPRHVQSQEVNLHEMQQILHRNKIAVNIISIISL